MAKTPQDVLDFWFGDLDLDDWFGPANAALDQRIHDELGAAHQLAVEGALNDWRKTPQGALALCLLLDQVPRNCFRGSPRAFATDPLALQIALEAIAKGFDQSDAFSDMQRVFFYLPLEHAEDLAVQQRCLGLMSALDQSESEWAKYAQAHLDIVEQFGRFPHRNRVLGRPCTMAERIYLRGVGEGFTSGGKAAVFGLDHVLVAVPDLDEAEAAWTGMGFRLTERGFHKDWPTANHCVMLGDHYIELIGRVGDGEAPIGIDETLARGGGICGLAFGGADAESVSAFLEAQNVPVKPAAKLSRMATGPINDREVSFDLVHPKDVNSFGLPAFICLHNDPDLMWQPALLQHDNQAIGLAEVTAAGATINDQVVDLYEAMVGPACLTRVDQGLNVDLWGIQTALMADGQASLTIETLGGSRQSFDLPGLTVNLVPTA